MRVEYDLTRRAVVAELHRRRAAELRRKASERSMSAARQEMEAEAAVHESYADKLMDFVDDSPKEANRKPDPQADINQVDAPIGENIP